MTIPQDMIRPEIAGLPAYNAGLALDRFRDTYGIDCLAKLDSNENPHGASPHAVAAIELAAASVASYPDAVSLGLRRQIGAALDLPAERIVIGNGSEDLIGAIYRAILRPGDHVVTICPSFGLHEFGAQACGATVEKLQFHDDWSFPVLKIEEALTRKPRVLIFSSPSNPAGPAISAAEFDQVVAALPPETLFVFDEAYVEFLSPEQRFEAPARLGATGHPWISLRTFSKAYGLAGLRVGYGLCSHPEFTAALMKTRNPFAVNAMATVAASAAFADTEHLDRSVNAIVTERERVAGAMKQAGFTVAPSQTNFLFFDCKRSGAEFAEALRHKGILVKGWLEPPFLNWARVTIGTPEENDAFLSALP
ncbi:aminotransferase class I/II-fold pyridoxal phosphate-dependent enzyme [Leisingera sp. XS_AS12]|uniref:aminotransferase class I/II-fold pyridoxal phosphate-dependent enzyme n=1 Tax=Leisingera sp. XS_AS12 TaxID=3241294 RepID=UPI0035111BF0